LNADDWYEVDTVTKIVNAFSHHPEAGMIHGAMRKWSTNGTVDATIFSKRKRPLFLGMPFSHPTCFVKKDIYNRLGNFDTSIPTSADYDFALRFVKAGEVATYIEEILSNFRKSGVTSVRKGFPICQVWRTLRKNNFGYIKSLAGLLFRLLRVAGLLVISLPLLKGPKTKIASILPHRRPINKTMADKNSEIPIL
jgi:hypothetical protein